VDEQNPSGKVASVVAAPFATWSDFLSTIIADRVGADATCPDCGKPVLTVDFVCPSNHPLRKAPRVLGETRFWVVNGARALAGLTALGLAIGLTWAVFAFSTLLFLAFFGMMLSTHRHTRLWFMGLAVIASVLTATLMFPDFGSNFRGIVFLVAGVFLTGLAIVGLVFTWLTRTAETWYLRGLTVNFLALVLYGLACAGLLAYDLMTSNASPPWTWLAIGAAQLSVSLLTGVCIVAIVSIGEIRAKEFGRQMPLPRKIPGPQRPTRWEARPRGDGIWAHIATQVDAIRVAVRNFVAWFVYETRVVVTNALNRAIERICDAIDFLWRALLRFADRTRRTLIIAYRTVLALVCRCFGSAAQFLRVALVPLALLALSFMLMGFLSRLLVDYVALEDREMDFVHLKIGFESAAFGIISLAAACSVGAFLAGCLASSAVLNSNPSRIIYSAVNGLAHYMMEGYLLFLVMSYALWLSGSVVPSNPYAFGPLMAAATLVFIAIMRPRWPWRLKRTAVRP
jgi:hypothetical protein